MGRVVRSSKVVTAALVLVIGIVVGNAWAVTPFTDIGGTGSHMDNIDAIYTAGITAGCAQGPTFYCPTDNVTRQQMASFLARLGGLSAGNTVNLPKVNGRSDLQSYCSAAAAASRTLSTVPCRAQTGIGNVNPGPGAGYFTDIVIGQDGLPLIAHADSDGDLRVTHCEDPKCEAVGTTTVIDADASITASPPRVAIGADGLPVIAYQHKTDSVGSGDLRIARCSSVACTFAALSTADTGGTGFNPSIAIAKDFRPVISYKDGFLNDGVLKVAHCTDLACNTVTTATVNEDGGRFTDIAIGEDGYAVISHYANENLWVAHCTSYTCDSGVDLTEFPTDGIDGSNTNIGIGPDGRPVVSHQTGDTSRAIRVMRCANTACTSGVTVDVPNAATSAEISSLTMGTNGLPIIAFADEGLNDIKVAFCRNPGCSEADIDRIVTTDDDDDYLAMTIGIDGVPLISHHGLVQNALMVSRPPLS